MKRKVMWFKLYNSVVIGRLTAQKGFDKLLDIWKKIEEKNSE